MYMCVECVYLSEKHIISKSVTMFIAQPFLVLIQRNTIKQVVVMMMVMMMMMVSTETILMATTADLVITLTAGGVVTGDGLTSVGRKQNIKHPSLRRQTKLELSTLISLY